MENEMRQTLLDKADQLLVLGGVSERTIGQAALGNNTFFFRLRGIPPNPPAGFTIKTYDRLIVWMDKKIAELTPKTPKKLPDQTSRQAN